MVYILCIFLKITKNSFDVVVLDNAQYFFVVLKSELYIRSYNAFVFFIGS